MQKPISDRRTARTANALLNWCGPTLGDLRKAAEGNGVVRIRGIGPLGAELCKRVLLSTATLDDATPIEDAIDSLTS